ncbi:glycoside hydrolase family 19 protein [Flavobacterium sp.]
MKFNDLQLRLLEETFRRYDITTPLRKAHFMATCDHESQGFTRFVENLNYSAEALLKLFKYDFDTDHNKVYSQSEMLKAIKLQRNPKAIANFIYANQNGNGNEASGDGWKHRGAGAIMLTGKGIQTDYFKENNQLVQPELLQSFQFAIDSAGWYWKKNKLNALADKDDVRSIRKKVNGGLIGFEDVKLKLAKYKSIYKC